MIIKIFFFAVLAGIIIARVQLQPETRRGPLHWNLFKQLIQTILFTLSTGLLLHQTDQIDAIRFYLYLISAGTSLAIFMTFERLIKRSRLAVMVATIAAGVVCNLFMTYRTEQAGRGSFIVGIAPGVGYLIWGFIKKLRQSYQHENDVH